MDNVLARELCGGRAREGREGERRRWFIRPGVDVGG